MSLAESPVVADEDSDPSIETYCSDAVASDSEEPDEEEEVEEEEEEGEGEEHEEEVEVEEEIEEEEVEPEDETKGKWEVSEPPVGADKDPKDLIQYVKSEGLERNAMPVSSVAENSNIISVEKNDSCKILTTKKEDFCLKHETSSGPNLRNIVATAEDDKHQGLDVDMENNVSPLQSKTFGEYNEQSCNSKAYLCGVNDMDSGTAKSSRDAGKDLAIDFLQRDFVEDDNGGQSSMTRIKQLEMQTGDDMKQMTSRFTSPDMRTRSLSPSTEMKDGNKRPAIICNFFAKGWCIRGSSCRFLHIKDHVNTTVQQAEGDLVTTNRKREVQLEEGLGDNAETSRTPGTPVPLAASMVRTSLYSSEVSIKETIQDEHKASPSRHPSQDKQKFSLLPKEDLSFKNHALPIGRDSSESRDSLFPEKRLMFNVSSNYVSMSLSSYPPCAEGLATVQSQHMYNKYTSPFMSHSLNSSLVTHLPTMGTSKSHQISAQSGYSLSLNSSIGASTLDAQKLLNSDNEYHSPRSTFFGSEQEDLPLISSSGVPPCATRYNSKISCYDWEPSVPFRPSFFITSTTISSPGDQYDPLCPTVDIPNIGDGSLKASYFIQGPSTQASSQVRTYGQYAVGGDKVADLNDDKSSLSSHNRFYENEPNKSCVPCEKDGLVPETETTGRTYLNSQNVKTGVRENTFGVEDITKTEKEQTEHDARHQGEGSRHKKKRVARAKKNNEMDVDFQIDSDLQNDLKALKNFRAALVDLVKELLKPKWQEGRLSKDAHNTIVKKSVDKVVSTLQPHQIPTATDMIKHYVSSSRLKIAKLVDGYVNKYGKS